MAEYIDLNNTEVLTEAGENAKLVVEEDGELKRIPASAVGQVKTVNGVEPDGAGNVVVSGLPEGVGGMVVNFALDTTGTTSLKADKPFAEVWETIKSNKSVSAYTVVSASGTYSAMLLSMVAATDPSDVDGKQLITFMALDTTGDNVKVITLKFYSDESVEVKNHTLENYVS